VIALGFELPRLPRARVDGSEAAPDAGSDVPVAGEGMMDMARPWTSSRLRPGIV
jgi:hypothetical protein